MNCAVCLDIELVMSDRQGIEIDHCPHCRGVWLDRGEIDKLIAGSPPSSSSSALANTPRPDFVDSGQHASGGAARPVRRKKSWLGELFD